MRTRPGNSWFFLVAALGLLVTGFSASAGNPVMAWGAGTVNHPADGHDFGQSIIPANLTNAVLVAAGLRHGVALKTDGTLQGWGDDTAGQIDLPPGSNYIAIACGYLDSVLLQANGTVSAVGDLGDAVASPTTVPINLSNVVAIAAGQYHCLALKADGTVAAWGTSTTPGTYVPNVDYGQSVVPAGLSNVVAIAAGSYHSLALKADGTLTGWGRVDYGQAYIPPGVSNVVAISAGLADSLALEANGKLVAWGDNTYGQTNVPSGLSNVVAIASGAWHNLALQSNGMVVAWGAGGGSSTYVDFGQNQVPGNLSNVVQIAAGSINSLALEGAGPLPAKVPLTVVGFGTNGFTMTLPTRNGRVYRLEAKDALTNQTWNAFPLRAGLNGTLWLNDPTPVAPQRFYRASRW
jgi:alpha-tubulin suppressor-like RCC1 family protein